MKSLNKQKGFTIVEALVSVAIVLIILTAFMQLVRYNYLAQQSNKRQIEAANLAAEAIEAVYGARYNNWTNISSLTMGTYYYPVISLNTWTLNINNPGLIDSSFTRWVVFEAVRRDGADNIIPSSQSGGVDDPNTKKVTAYVEWNDRGQTKQINVESYVTNWSN